MARWRNARLINRETRDHLIQVHKDVPDGKVYLVDVDSKRMQIGWNTKKGISWLKELVTTHDGGWMPTEILEIEK